MVWFKPTRTWRKLCCSHGGPHKPKAHKLEEACLRHSAIQSGAGLTRRCKTGGCQFWASQVDANEARPHLHTIAPVYT
jgi:hypothetical protein